MTTRDRQSYIEEVGQLPDGTKLLTWHNLTAADLILIRDLMAEHRRRNLVVLTEGTGFTNPIERTGIALENERIDHLTTQTHIRS